MESGKDKISFSLNINDASELVSLIKNDNTEAFKNFFFLFQPGIYKFLLRFLSDPDAAKDLTQDTFINFWSHRHQLDSSKSAKAYLFKIARNLAVNHLNRNHFDARITFKQNEFLAAIINPEEEYDKHFLMNEFQQAVNKLPERCRATFILCKYEGFEYSEIAEILDVSLQTVKNQMNKALSILKKLLAAHLE